MFGYIKLPFGFAWVDCLFNGRFICDGYEFSKVIIWKLRKIKQLKEQDNENRTRTAYN